MESFAVQGLCHAARHMFWLRPHVVRLLPHWPPVLPVPTGLHPQGRGQ